MQKKVEIKNLTENQMHVYVNKKGLTENSFYSRNKENFLNFFTNRNHSFNSSKPLEDTSKISSKNKTIKYYQKGKMSTVLSIPSNNSKFNDSFYDQKYLNTISSSFNKKLYPPRIQIYEINLSNKLQLNKIHNSKIKNTNDNKNNIKYYKHSTHSSNKTTNNKIFSDGKNFNDFENKENICMNNTINYNKNINNFNNSNSISNLKKDKALNTNKIPRPHKNKKNSIPKINIINENKMFFESYDKMHNSVINNSISSTNLTERKKYNSNINTTKNNIIQKPDIRNSCIRSHYLKNMEQEGVNIWFKKFHKNDCIDLISPKVYEKLKKYSLSIPIKHINTQNENIARESNLINTINNRSKNIYDISNDQYNNLRKKYIKKLSQYLLKYKNKNNIVQKKNKYKLINLNEKIKQERINRSLSKSRSKEKGRKIVDDKNIKDGPFATDIKKEDDIGGKIDLTYNFKVINNKKINLKNSNIHYKEVNINIKRSILIVKSSKIIQKWWRSLLKKLFVKIHIIKIQAVLRGYLFRKNFIYKRNYEINKVILIQRKWKRYLYNRHKKENLFSFKQTINYENNDITNEDNKSSSELLPILIPFRNDTLEIKSYEDENLEFNEIYTINKDNKNYLFTKILQKNMGNKIILIQNAIKLFLISKKQLKNEMNKNIIKKIVNNKSSYINKKRITLTKNYKKAISEIDRIDLSIIQKEEDKNSSEIKYKYNKITTNKIIENNHQGNIINYTKNTEFSINPNRKQEIQKNLPINLICFITKQNLLPHKKNIVEFKIISNNNNEFICSKKKNLQLQISNSIKNSYLASRSKSVNTICKTQLTVTKINNNEIKTEEEKIIKNEISTINNNQIIPTKMYKNINLLTDYKKEVNEYTIFNLIKLPSIKQSYFSKNFIAYEKIYRRPLNHEICYYSKIKKDSDSLKNIKYIQEYFIYYLLKKREMIFTRVFSKQIQLNSIITKIRKDSNISNEKKIILIQRKIKTFLKNLKIHKKNNTIFENVTTSCLTNEDFTKKMTQLKILTNSINENKSSINKIENTHSNIANTISLLNDSNNITQKEIMTNENTLIFTKNITNENIINENNPLNYFINLLTQKIIKYNNQYVFQKIQIYNFINKKLNHLDSTKNNIYEDDSILFSISDDYEPQQDTFFFDIIKRHIEINRKDNNFEENNDVNILFKENLPCLFDQEKKFINPFPYITPIQENNLIKTELFIFNDEKLADYIYKCYKIEKNMIKITPTLIKNRLVKNPLLYQNIFSITRYMDELYKYYINGSICCNCFCKSGELCLSGCYCHSNNLKKKKNIDFDINKFKLTLKQKEKNSNIKNFKYEVLKKYRESIVSPDSNKNINNTTVISEMSNNNENIENINHNNIFTFNKSSEKIHKHYKKVRKITNYKQLNKTIYYEYKIEKKTNLSKCKSNSPNGNDENNNDYCKCIKKLRKSSDKKETINIIPNNYKNAKTLNEFRKKYEEIRIKKNKGKVFIRDTGMDTNNQVFEDV